MSNNNYNKQPLDLTGSDVEKSDDEAIGFLLNCVERGEYRGKQRAPSICKVSRILRDLSESSFIPQLVSIGPIHREDQKLKECFLYDLLKRCDSTQKKALEACAFLKKKEALEACVPKETILEDCLLKVSDLTKQIRESYAGIVEDYSEVDLARMMVMDGCFILEFCFKHIKKNENLPNKMQSSRIAMDLLLLENQVPFVVLQALFDCLAPYINLVNAKGSVTLSQLLDDFLLPYVNLFHSPKKISTTNVDSDSTHDHVLGYLHKRYQLVDEEQAAKSSNPIHAGILWCSVNFCKKPRILLKQLCSSFCKNKSSNPTDAEEDEEGKENTAFCSHSIVELDRSGMNFKPHQKDIWSMTIEYQPSLFPCLPLFWSKPTLLMPTLIIDDTTELILRNLIAYEQSFPQKHYYFTSYANAMDKLIDSQEDIAKLVKSKVLVNHLGSNQEAADLINKICKNMFVTEFYYTQEFIQMDKYYTGYWPNNIAWLRRVYFSNPWSAIALLAAIILFSLTVVQTIYTIRAA